jgi:voltage-gated potassium channel
VEFALRLWLSPDRSEYLKHNGLDALAVALPVFRAVRAIRAVRLVVFGSRGANELIERLRRRRLAKLAVVSGFVVLIGAALLYLTEQGQGSAIRSFGDALYWATMMLVGTEGGLEMRTTLGRLITLGLIGYSIVVFSYVVGAIASLWVERDREEREGRAAQAGTPTEPPSR